MPAVQKIGSMSVTCRFASHVPGVSSIAPMLMSNYARAEMIAPDDPGLKIEEITYSGPAGDVKGYLAMPADASGPLPAVIVVHENRGLNPHIKDVTRRLALEGFVTLGIDLLSRQGGTPATDEQAAEMIHLDDILVCITQEDVIYRRVFDKNHRSYVPDFGVFIKADINGKIKHFAVSRQMVLFAVERRKAWRMLQSKAGIVNKDYLAQKSLLAKLEKGEISQADLQGKTRELFEKELATLG